MRFCVMATDLPSASDVLADALAALFGDDHARRWPECLAAAGGGETWRSLGAAILAWVACLDEPADLCAEVQEPCLSSVKHPGGLLTAEEALEHPSLIGLIHARPADAIAAAITDDLMAGIVQGLSLREDSGGGQGIDLHLLIGTTPLTVIYGDGFSEKSPLLLTQRGVAGEVFRVLCRAILSPTPSRVAGATGPELPEAA